MENNIIEAADLPEDEKVYLKKDWLGWRVVEPDSKWLGSKRTWFQLAIYMTIVLCLYFGINELIANYKVIASNPCDYCKAFIPKL